MKKTIFLTIVALLSTLDLAQGATRLVPDEYATIQAAIDDSNDGDVVIVAPATYTGTGNRDIDFNGKEITVRSENGPESCIIDCNGTEDDPHRGFYFHSGEDTNSVLSGFTITNGHGLEEQFGSYMWSLGGGIYCIGSGPTISNCIIRGNLATQGGGIFVWENSSPRITGCTVSGNSSGIYCWRNSSLNIEDSIISGTDGRGIYCGDSPAVSIVNCTISSNQYAGIRYDGYGSLVIKNCTIFDNQGPGIQGSVESTGTGTISNCVISGNNARFDGGGIRISTDEQGLATIINCTITGNSAIDSFGNIGRGGGVSCSRGNIIIANSIIRNNIGEDIYVWNYPPPPCQDCTVEPTEVAVSYSCTGQIIVEEDPVFGDPNLILGAGNIDADPCFVEAGYWDINIPPSPPSPPSPPLSASSMSDTLQYIWVGGDYHLKSQAGRWEPNSQDWVQDAVTSPCIDAGNPMSPIGNEPFPNGGRVNMGAYGGTRQASKSYFGEPVCKIIVAGDINGDCRINFLDFALMALHWLECIEPNQEQGHVVEDDTEDSYSCEGNFDVSFPCSNAVDEDWDTYALPADGGATSYIYENYIIPAGIKMAEFTIKYRQTAAVTPGLCTNVTDYWDGSTWKELECTALTGQISTLTVEIPDDALSGTTLQLRTRIWKSLDLPGSGSGMYYEGKVIWYLLPVCRTIVAGGNKQRL